MEHAAPASQLGAEVSQGPTPGAMAGADQGGVPQIDIRVVLFTILEDRLKIALQEETGGFRLLRGPVTPEETLDSSARRIVRERIDARELYLEQLYTLSVGDAQAWTVIVAYLALVWSGPDPASDAGQCWFELDDLPALSAADRMVIDYALIRLRAKIGYTTIAFHLLPPAFTLRELQTTYETILGNRLDKRNFRRRVIAAGMLEPTGDKRRDGSHRPAVVYRFRATHERERYLTPPWTDDA